MSQKEERIVFPMPLLVLTNKDWSRCRLDEGGCAFGVFPGDEWSADEQEQCPANRALINLATGQFRPEVIDVGGGRRSVPAKEKNYKRAPSWQS